MNAVQPALSVLFAVLATAVPWGLPADATFILPLVVVMMVFCWRVLPGAALPPYAAVLLGLLTDIVSGGPLGFWALMTLTAAIAGGWAPPLVDGQDMKRLWLVWCGVACTVAGLGWSIASLYFVRWIEWWPIAFGALASIALFPVVLQGLLWIRHGSLKRGWHILYGRWS